MLALQPSPSPRSLQPNLLPTRINHTGPIRVSKRYWNPQERTSPANTNNSSEERRSSTKESHFRGRKLLSRSLRLPENYKGYVVVKTDEILPSTVRSARREREESMKDAPEILDQDDEDAGGAMNEDEDEMEEDSDSDPLLKIMLQEKKRAAQQPSKSIPTPNNNPPLNNNGEEEITTHLLKPHATFTSLEIWGHEAIAGDEDVFVRGVEEWISFAEVMHGRRG